MRHHAALLCLLLPVVMGTKCKQEQVLDTSSGTCTQALVSQNEVAVTATSDHGAGVVSWSQENCACPEVSPAEEALAAPGAACAAAADCAPICCSCGNGSGFLVKACLDPGTGLGCRYPETACPLVEDELRPSDVPCHGDP